MMFYFMMLVWANTHVDEDCPYNVPHPLENTTTHYVLGGCGVLSVNARYFLEY